MDDLISRKEAVTLPVMPVQYRHYQTMNLDDVYEQGWEDCQKCIERHIPAIHPKTAKIKVIRSECGDLCGCECGTCGVSLDFVDNYCWRCGAKLIKEVSK